MEDLEPQELRDDKARWVSVCACVCARVCVCVCASVRACVVCVRVWSVCVLYMFISYRGHDLFFNCYRGQEIGALLEIGAPPEASAATDDKARPATLELLVLMATLEPLVQRDLQDHKVGIRWLYLISASRTVCLSAVLVTGPRTSAVLVTGPRTSAVLVTGPRTYVV